MEEMETEPIAQEPGGDESNTILRRLDHIREDVDSLRRPQPDDIRRKEWVWMLEGVRRDLQKVIERMSEQQRLDDIRRKVIERMSEQQRLDDIRRKEGERMSEQQRLVERQERRLVDQSQLISPSSQWEKYICPDCDNLMDDPIQTSCGHQMCYGCFDQRRRSWWLCCPVRGDDVQEHKMSENDWQRNNIANDQINKLMVRCNDCGPMSVKDYREQEHSIEGTSKLCQMNKRKLSDFYKSFANYIGEKDLDYLKKLLLKDRVIQRQPFLSAENVFAECLQTQQYQGLEKFLNCLLRSDHTGHSYEDFVLKLQKITKEGCGNIASYVLEVGHKDCLEMAAKWHGAVTELEKLSPDQQQAVLTQVLKETLPAAKRHLSIDEIRQLLYQNGVISREEANELLGISTGEEKITRLYTEMLPKKGMIGLKKFMGILFDTGWDTSSHLRHHALLSKTLADKLDQINSAKSVLCQHNNQTAAKEAIVPVIYSESLPDAVVNLSQTINKLLLPMFKEDLVSISEYFGLRQFFHGGIFYHEEKVEDLYMILPQKGVEGLKGFMKVLQDTGRRIPSYQEHLNLMTSTLQFTCLSKTVDKVKWIESVASDLHDHGVVDGTQDSGVPVIYSESLPDAVVNLSRSINKLLLPMLKKQVITTSEYYWLREQQSPEEKVAILYKVILPQKGVKGLQDYMELLQDTGKNIPRHQKHVNLMKSKL